MKTFAYLALIGSAMAVRLMEDAPKPTVEGAESIHDVAELRLEDLEGEMEGLGECFGKGTKEALEEVDLASDEIEELGEKLEKGAHEGATLGDAVELLRAKAKEHDVGSEDQEAFLDGVLKKVKGCKRDRKGDKSGSGSDGEGSVEEIALAQTGEEDSVDMEDAKEFAREAKEAFDDLDSEEQDAVVAEVKEALGDRAEEVVDAMKEGAEEKLREAYESLDDDQKEMLADGVRAVKEHKEGKEGGEGRRGPKKEGEGDEKKDE